MATPTKYFHDRSVLLLLAINFALFVTGTLFVLFHLDSSKGSTYIIQCRYCDTATHEFKSGSVADMSSFVLFMVVTTLVAFILSRRVHSERRLLALNILVLTTLLLVFAVIVSYSLFSLR